MTTVFLSLGSNLGNRKGFLEKAARDLSQIMRKIKISGLYESEPLGAKDNKDQPWFLNAVIVADTSKSPQELLAFIKGLEIAAGRDVMTADSGTSPRTLDIDILYYGDQVIETPTLIIPHTRLHLRRFVLMPLKDVAISFLHPVFKKTTIELLMECTDTSIVRSA